MAEQISKTKYLCLHCGEAFLSTLILCKNCKTKEQRAKMDAENKEIFEKDGLKFNCEYCLKEKNLNK